MAFSTRLRALSWEKSGEANMTSKQSANGTRRFRIVCSSRQAYGSGSVAEERVRFQTCPTSRPLFYLARNPLASRILLAGLFASLGLSLDILRERVDAA